MSFPLTSLPPELLTKLAKQVSPDDIVNLFTSLHIDVTKEIYNSVFHDNTNFDEYNFELFKGRTAAQLYVFGSPGLGAFGSVKGLAEHFQLEFSPKGELLARMISPYKMPSVPGTVVQVSARAQAIQMLTSQGDVYFTGSAVEDFGYGEQMVVLDSFECEYSRGEWDELAYDGSGDSKGFIWKAVGRYEDAEDSVTPDNPPHTLDAALTAQMDKYFGQKCEPSKFVEVTSRGNSFFALDDSGLVWEWSAARHPRQGVPVLFADTKEDSAKLVRGKVTKVRVGSTYTSCMIEGRGIVCWSSRETVTGWKDGFPVHHDRLSLARVATLPDTESGIKDYFLCGDVAVILRTDGSVYAAGVYGIFPIDEPSFSEEDVFDVDDINKEGPFVQVASSDFFFGLVSQSGTVVLATFDNTGTCIIRGIFKDLDVASVAMGQTQCLALTKKGDVYSWGRETDCDGCLGLGTEDQALKLDGVKMDDGSLNAVEFVRLDLPSRAYGVFAGFSLSGVLM